MALGGEPTQTHKIKIMSFFFSSVFLSVRLSQMRLCISFFLPFFVSFFLPLFLLPPSLRGCYPEQGSSGAPLGRLTRADTAKILSPSLRWRKPRFIDTFSSSSIHVLFSQSSESCQLRLPSLSLLRAFCCWREYLPWPPILNCQALSSACLFFVPRVSNTTTYALWSP